jgi:hypothetical protein
MHRRIWLHFTALFFFPDICSHVISDFHVSFGIDVTGEHGLQGCTPGESSITIDVVWIFN